MSKTRKRANGRSLRALLLTVVLAALALALFAGTALAAPPWSDAPNSWWVATYQTTDLQVGTVADGYPDGTFRPGLDVTRGQFAKMVVDGAGVATATPYVNTFADVTASNYFYPWIEGGAAARIISGFADGTFGPVKSIIRQQANSILGSYLAQKELSLRGHITGRSADYPSLNTWFVAEGVAILAAYADVDRVATVHAPATAYLIFKGVVQGTYSAGRMYLAPNNNLTRAQAAALILRVQAVSFALPVPTVSALNPASGPAAGGTSVVITGTNFTGASAVKFGAFSANYMIDSATQITAVAPAGTAGTTVDVTVTTSAGTSSAAGTGNDYTYKAYATAPSAIHLTKGASYPVGGVTDVQIPLPGQ
ncbi:MAG: S-layer homology domain-containing protein, partial [Thermoleophilia bacterium]|nr:S-layer homology domain-containing protein [Thermoleophilia bacterium]